jgi:hypothetical protein
MKSTKNRLSRDFAKFFSEGEGRGQKWRAFFKNKDYRPHFELNTHTTEGIDYFDQFWAPYRDSKRPTHILYPEPTFFVDSDGTYLRNPRINSPEDRKKFAFAQKWGELKTSHSYVPSGTVSALLRMLDLFRKLGREITPKEFLPHDRLVEGPNLIVLGTSTSMQAVKTLETGLPFRTGLQHVTVEGEAEPLKDSETEGDDGLMYLKWGTLTRRWHQSRDRYVTTIPAHHGRAIDAIAQYVSDPANMPFLAEKLGQPKTLPHGLQSVFSINMEETPRGPHMIDMAIDRALDITTHLR